METVSSFSQLIPFCCTHHLRELKIPRHRNSQATTTVIRASITCNSSHGAFSSSTRDTHRGRSSFESPFCDDKGVPEQIIENPIGVSIAEKLIGARPRCTRCQARGAVLCITCSGSGLYIDSILESQGVIVRVQCLGCGGTGNILCAGCGGRGHL
ncbi:hypothetical protein Dimus_034630 [Dionaea muscipula]